MENDVVLFELKNIIENKLNTTCKFIFADMSSANLGVDNLKAEDFPVVLYLAGMKVKNDVEASLAIRKKISMSLFVLERTSRITLDVNHMEANQILNKCRKICDNIIFQINQSYLSVNGGVDKFETIDYYEKFDAQLCGQALIFEWDTIPYTTGA